MKPAPLIYKRADDIASAQDMVAKAQGFAKLIAGGQTLGPMINLRLTQPDVLIDVSRIPALRRIEERGGVLHIGAGVRHAEIEDGRVPDVTGGLMRRAARTLAYRAVRNRGTIGGSLAHADPVAEWPTVLSALGASVLIAGRTDKRETSLDRFFVGYLTTILEPDDVLEAVLVPKLPAGSRVGYHKFCRKHGEFAQSLAAVVAGSPGSGPGGSRVVLGSAGSTPLVLASVAAIVAERRWRDGIESEIRRAVVADLAALGKTLDAYDAHLHSTIVVRAVKEAIA